MIISYFECKKLKKTYAGKETGNKNKVRQSYLWQYLVIIGVDVPQKWFLASKENVGNNFQHKFIVVDIVVCLPSTQSFFFSIGGILCFLSPYHVLRSWHILEIIEKLKQGYSGHFIILTQRWTNNLHSVLHLTWVLIFYHFQLKEFIFTSIMGSHDQFGTGDTLNSHRPTLEVNS